MWMGVLEAIGRAEWSSGIHGRLEGTVCQLARLPSHQKLPELFEEHLRQSFRENVGSLILAWNWKYLDTVLAVAKMRTEPMVFDVPVLVARCETGRVRCRNVESSLVVFKRVTDERYTVAGDFESGSNFFENMAKRDESAHSRCE